MSEGELSLLTTVYPRLCVAILARPHREQIPGTTTEEKMCQGQVEVPMGVLLCCSRAWHTLSLLGLPSDLVLVIKSLFAVLTPVSALRLECGL